MTDRTPTGVELRRQSRALARIHAERLLNALRRDDDAGVMAALSELHAGASVALGAYVAGLRDEGTSWATIGAALGVSKQAVSARFGPGRPSSVEDAPAELVELLAREGYDGRVPAHKLTPSHVGHLSGRCYQRHHAGHPSSPCPGHANGDPCACWCHAPAADSAVGLFLDARRRGELASPEWD